MLRKTTVFICIILIFVLANADQSGRGNSDKDNGRNQGNAKDHGNGNATSHGSSSNSTNSGPTFGSNSNNSSPSASNHSNPANSSVGRPPKSSGSSSSANNSSTHHTHKKSQNGTRAPNTRSSDQLPVDLRALDDEVEKDNQENPPPAVYDNAKPKPCAGETHYLLKTITTLKKKKIYQEYQDNKCNADYHDKCTSLINCDDKKIETFCPKSCNSKNCYQLRFFGYLNPNERPEYNMGNCTDKDLNCEQRYKNGDFLTSPEEMSTLCANTTGTCAADKDYLPYMPEELKLTVWLGRYDNKKYSKYSRYLEAKRKIVIRKAQQNLC